jgi:hypothetical protein
MVARSEIRDVALAETLDWPIADSYSIAVDSEFGILLRFEAHLDGRLYSQYNVEDVDFNEPFDSSLFQGPEGATLRRT